MFRALYGLLRHAHPVGRHQQEGRIFRRLIIDQHAFTRQRADGIGNVLDFHERHHSAMGFQASAQISRAVSTTRRSLASCSCGLIGLPSSMLAKPHWGLMARRS